MDTIAAIATPPQRSAIGIVRISGADTFHILESVFVPSGKTPLGELPSHRMIYGTMLDGANQSIDRGLCVLFRGGHSYTGEDSAELHCHGSPVVLQAVLSALFAAGARQARAGEFTRRAFLNGRMDLTQAEAVIDLIDAETADAARNALGQVDGTLARKADEVYRSLNDIASRFYAVVDYPDEDIEALTFNETEGTLLRAEETLCALLATAQRGNILKNGVSTAIIGAPNAGKSSLLNALVGYERAIVADVAGTTRDTVEEKAVVGGVLLRLVDTAGMHESRDRIEQLGIERSRRAVEQSDLILVTIDGHKELVTEDIDVLRLAQKSGKPWICVVTKADLSGASRSVGLAGADAPPTVSLSSVTGEGIPALEAEVQKLFPALEPVHGQFLTNARQIDAVKRAHEAVSSALAALRGGVTPDAVLTDTESAMNALGELTGRTAREDIVSRIFERFCVGK